jgi:hypothetical protein
MVSLLCFDELLLVRTRLEHPAGREYDLSQKREKIAKTVSKKAIPAITRVLRTLGLSRKGAFFHRYGEMAPQRRTAHFLSTCGQGWPGCEPVPKRLPSRHALPPIVIKGRGKETRLGR